KARLIRDQNVAARVQIKRQKTQKCGDGNCYVQFVNVGMGDCTLIATPLGRRIMIDCGSTSLFDVVLDPALKTAKVTAIDCIANTIKSELFLNGATTIDLLVLTHPDADHDNKLEAILRPLKIKASVVYFGGTEDLTAYGSSGYIQEIS